jgi:hypothetical protein
MSKIDAQVVQRTRHFHHKIGTARFGVAKHVFDDTTAFDARQDMFDDNPFGREQAIHELIDER